MAGIQGNHFVVLGTVANIEIIRTYCIAFPVRYRILLIRYSLSCSYILLRNLIQRVFQQSTVFHAVYSDVFAAIVYPQVHDTRIALGFTHLFGYGTTTFGVLNPEVADTFIGI